MSSDPITGTTKNIGKLAVNIACNDLASFGVEPVGLLVTILAPSGTTERDICAISDQLNETASQLNVEIIGGHTEITDSVTRFVLVSTAVGKICKNRIICTNGAMPGDKIIVTKYVGQEGTAIIAAEKEQELSRHFGPGLINDAKNYFNHLSVIKEGLIAAGYEVTSMHDVTEGGLLGAVWEVCEASGKGADIYYDKIPVSGPTRKICDFYGIDPLRLVSSGCMLICCKGSDAEKLVSRLVSEGIPAAIIGEINDNGHRLLHRDSKAVSIDEPLSDELYKVIKFS